MVLSNFRIAIFSNIRVFYDGKEFSSDETLPIMIGRFSKYFKKIYLIAPVLNTKERKGRHIIDIEKIEIHPLRYFTSGFQLYIAKLPIIAFQILGWFIKSSRRWNAAWIIDPLLPSQIFYLSCKLFRKPSILYLRCNDEYEILKRNKTGIRRLLARGYGLYLRSCIPLMVNNMSTLVTGEDLYRRYKNCRNHVYKVVATTVTETDILSKKPNMKGRLTSKRIRLLSVGNLIAIKGHDYLIEALQLLTKENEYSFTLTLIGTGNYESVIRAKIENLGLTDQVRLIGYIPHGELNSFYEKADIFVLPSLSEGTPKVIPEAMAKGLPVIATSVGGTPSLIDHMKNGIIVEPKNPGAIAEAVLNLVKDQALRKLIIENSLKSAEKFTIKHQVKTLVKILTSTYPTDS